jgi:BirA family biotin operon repressor/biotin-[acetyl-CoA-carboxylase] ligase
VPCFTVMADYLSVERIKENLKTRFVGRSIVYYPRLESTMDTARQAAIDCAPEGTVILACEQTAGRGRLKRSWLSPRGCLTFSLILYPETRFLPFLVMASALAVADTVESVASLEAEIKWPNDVLVKGKKVSGILIETGIREGRPNFAVIGIGLNVNLDLADCPEISDTATSLAAETEKKLSREAVLLELLARLESRYEMLLNGEPVFETWRSLLVTLGKEVSVRAGTELYEGLAEDVAPDGALLLRMAGGHLLKMPAGDVTLRA